LAGTLFGLSLSQRVDLNGIPAVGWLLYLYQANTSTPVNSYQDTALTLLNPWPIQADAYGMMRQFWLADGNYRARATSADGAITYFDQQAILALGASSGAAPSGGVDPNAIYQTGDVMWLDRQGTRAGWVRDNGKTIGSATSGATEPGGNVAEAQPLYEYLWNNFSQTFCPVLGGRGANALADWNEPKQLTLPDRRGMFAVGLDDMGNSAAGRLMLAPIVSGGVTTAGSTIGENGHTLALANTPAHTHVATVTDPGHSHVIHWNEVGFVNGAAPAITELSSTPDDDQSPTASATTGITVSNASQGGGGAHNNVPLCVPGTFYRKL
jgi:hypothetical protein